MLMDCGRNNSKDIDGSGRNSLSLSLSLSLEKFLQTFLSGQQLGK